MNDILNLAQAAAFKAAKIAERVRASGNLGLNMKGNVNLCTQADIEAEKIIIECIHSRFPEHAILSEESNSTLNGRDFLGPLWIIDPIDGTTNFAHGHSHVGISIAFSDKGIVQDAIVYSPFQNELFSATKGSGAYLNGSSIAVNTSDNLRSALVATGFPYERDDLKPLFQRLRAIAENCRDIRRLGAASLDISWVACGRLDIFYEDLMPWDMAAACLIAKEAGAVVDYYSAEKSDLPRDLQAQGIVVTNKLLIEKVLAILRL